MEIELVQLEKDLEKIYLKQYLKNENLLDFNIFKKNYINQIKEKKLGPIINNEIRSIIQNSEEYKKLEEEYKTYITSLANFMKSQNISDSIGVAFLYNLMLTYGYLSASHTHKYKNNINQNLACKYEIIDLLGSRVVTGESVCRHMSSALNDLETEMGNKSLNIGVVSVNKDMPVDEYDKLKPNHCISIITDKTNNTAFGYCPTNHYILNLESKSSTNKTTNYLECSPIMLGIDTKANNTFKYISRENNIIITKNNNLEESIKIFRLENMTNADVDLIEARNIDLIKYFYNYDSQKEINNFYIENVDLLHNIKEHTEYLMPITKEKVKQLVIKSR